MPPHCGAIYWVRLLFYRLKRPILIFQKQKELMESPLKDETFQSYLKFAKELKAYEQSEIVLPVYCNILIVMRSIYR